MAEGHQPRMAEKHVVGQGKEGHDHDFGAQIRVSTYEGKNVGKNQENRGSIENGRPDDCP
jgi:hypothetical protein